MVVLIRCLSNDLNSFTLPHFYEKTWTSLYFLSMCLQNLCHFRVENIALDETDAYCVLFWSETIGCSHLLKLCFTFINWNSFREDLGCAGFMFITIEMNYKILIFITVSVISCCSFDTVPFEHQSSSGHCKTLDPVYPYSQSDYPMSPLNPANKWLPKPHANILASLFISKQTTRKRVCACAQNSRGNI